MSRKCDHDWFDHYMMYSMMNNTGNTGGGGNDWGCLLIILACILFLPAFYLFILYSLSCLFYQAFNRPIG